MWKAPEESNLNQLSLSCGVELCVSQRLSGSLSIVLTLWVVRMQPNFWLLLHREAPFTSLPCPSGSCLLSSRITKRMTMATSRDGWAATGDTEQKSDKTENENAVSEDLQKSILTEGLHSRQWWEPAYWVCNTNRERARRTERQGGRMQQK